MHNHDVELQNHATRVNEDEDANEDNDELTSYMSCRQEVAAEDMDLEGIDDEVQNHEIVG